ncbi:hypothetical protein AAKU67_000907 [Oxalobacteraceae bacterium GrIS 2.11]
MSQINKIIGQVGLVTVLVALLFALVGVISTDAYSVAAQAQAHGDLALMQLGEASSNDTHSPVTNLLLNGSADHQVTTQ